MNRIVSAVLSLACFATLLQAQVPTNGLVAYLPLNNNTIDVTGNGADGTIVGGVAPCKDRFGNANGAYSFNGAGYISAKNSPALAIGTHYSMVFWFLTAGPGPVDWQGLVSKAMGVNQFNAGPRTMLGQYLHQGAIKFYTMASPPYWSDATALPLETNYWYFYTLTADGDSIRQYLNGKRIFTFPFDASWSFTNANPLTLGGLNGFYANYMLNGALDEVRIYNRKLGESEIQAIFADGNTVSLSMPDTVAVKDASLEIPVYAGELTGKGVLSYQFTIKLNSPDSILSAAGDAVTVGTLSGAASWIVKTNTTVPNAVTIAAAGASPLAGRGVLLKIRLAVNPGVPDGKYSLLRFSDALLNAGSPQVITTDGKITLGRMVCGDADENGLVQAYDAALTLREAVGPMPAPPLPLTAQGKLNADVDRNGVIQAYDAALILKHVAGLPMPAGVATCFEATDSPAVQFPAQVTFAISELRKDAQSTQLVVKCSGVDSSAGVIALSFDIGLASLSSTAALSTLPDGYLAYVNQLNDGRVRVAVINPHGIAAKDVQMAITLGENEWLGGVRIDNVVLNNTPASGALLGVSPSAGTIQTFALVGAYPNPFNPSTRIVVDIPQRTSVRLEIYNAVGTRIRTLLSEPVGQGRHEIVWDGQNDSGQTVSSGQYFCRMRADAFTRTIRLILLK